MGEDMVERCARALHLHEDSWNDTAWEYLPEGTQALFLGQARVAIEATHAPNLLAVLQDILPSKLCGESYNLPDSEHVAIDITFGKLKAARAAITAALGGEGHE